MVDDERVAREVIDAAIEVHRCVGPGFLESTYEICLAHELRVRGLSVDRQAELVLQYKGLTIRAMHRADLVVASCVLVEVKTAEQVVRAHVAQVLTYLRWSGLRIGLILNFARPIMAQGIQRIVLDRKSPDRAGGERAQRDRVS